MVTRQVPSPFSNNTTIDTDIEQISPSLSPFPTCKRLEEYLLHVLQEPLVQEGPGTDGMRSILGCARMEVVTYG